MQPIRRQSLFDSGSGESALSVRDVNRLARSTLESMHSNVCVEGEISGLFRAGSGHCYLTLKDADAEIKAMIWRPAMQRMKIRPEDGQQVRVTGKLTIYEARGTFQLSIETMVEVGAGALDARLRKLREKYDQLGWFGDEHKKPLPYLPATIGLVTSPNSAAVHDMLRVIYDRHPRAHVIVYGVLVQGEQARYEIATAIERANADREVDVLVVGRGGGSQEDLWAFNEPEVVEAVFHSEIPLVSAVGHEVDTSLSDLVADRRALTPTDAGSLVVPDVVELIDTLKNLVHRVDRSMRRELQQLSQRLDMVRESRELRNGSGLVEPYRVRILAANRQSTHLISHEIEAARLKVRALATHVRGASPSSTFLRQSRQLGTLSSRIAVNAVARTASARALLTAASQHLAALSPLAILDRGYSITTSSRTGDILRSAAEALEGEELTTRLASGTLTSRVIREDGC